MKDQHTYPEMLENLRRLSEKLMKRVSASPDFLRLKHYNWSMDFIKDMIVIAAFQNTDMCTEAHLAQIREWASEVRRYAKEDPSGLMPDSIKDIVGYLEWQASERQQTTCKSESKPVN